MMRAGLEASVKPLLADGVPVSVQRAGMETLGRGNKVPSGTSVEPVTLDGVGGERVSPPGPPLAPAAPTILYLHGGGYVWGSPRGERVLAAVLGREAAAATISLDYRLAPENPHPAALDDAVAAYRALLADGAAPARVALFGDSAGGGLALATTIRLKAEGVPLPAALYLISPWLDLSLSGASITEREDLDPMLSVAGIARFADLYRGELAASDPGCSPLFGDLAGLPPTLVQVGSDEILLSDSERFVERAGEAGSQVELERYEGLWHNFQLHAGVLPSSEFALARAGAFLKRAWMAD